MADINRVIKMFIGLDSDGKESGDLDTLKLFQTFKNQIIKMFVSDVSVNDNQITVTKDGGTTSYTLTAKVDVDDALSTTSTNPVQNKVITAAMPTKVSQLSNDNGYISEVEWSAVLNKPSAFTPASHSQASNTINALTGYAKATAVSAIANTDTLNEALGKLEKALDGKQASGSYLTTNGTAAKATADADGNTITATYIKDVSYSGQTVTVTKGDGTSSAFNTKDTTYSNMTAATASAAGKAGLVPAPAAGAQTKYLRGDGTWQTPPDTNTTYSAMKGATTSAAGAAGLVPAPTAGAANRYLRSDGTWVVPPDTNTTYSVMGAATASAAGTSGLVPAPAAGKNTSFLRGDGTWVVPTNTTYSNMTAATASAAGKAGLVPAPAAGAQTKYLRGDGTWQTPPTDIAKTTFTATDAKWGTASGGYYPLTIPLGGKNFFGVYRANGSNYDKVECAATVSGTNIIIYSIEKFAGYVLLV